VRYPIAHSRKLQVQDDEVRIHFDRLDQAGRSVRCFQYVVALSLYGRKEDVPVVIVVLDYKDPPLQQAGIPGSVSCQPMKRRIVRTRVSPLMGLGRNSRAPTCCTMLRLTS
jgi:hypothetical protein